MLARACAETIQSFYDLLAPGERHDTASHHDRGPRLNASPVDATSPIDRTIAMSKLSHMDFLLKPMPTSRPIYEIDDQVSPKININTRSTLFR